MIEWTDERAGDVLNRMAKDMPLIYGIEPDAIGILAMKYASKRLKELAENEIKVDEVTI